MANVTFRCPNCQATDRATLPASEIACSACAVKIPVRSALDSTQQLKECVICGSSELFVRKDFPQRLGVTIVLLGFLASFVTWYFQWIVATYAILFGTAAIDVVLYFVMGNVLECYQCHSQYRGIPELEGHNAFDLEIHERHRQQAARMKDAGDSNATATKSTA